MFGYIILAALIVWYAVITIKRYVKNKNCCGDRKGAGCAGCSRVSECSQKNRK